MTVRSFPFYRLPGQQGDQQPAEDDYYRMHRETGVLSGLGITFNGLTYSLAVGDMYASGSMLLVESTPATGASQPTTAANPRRDMLVARRTLTADGASNTALAIKQGNPAAAPQDPALVQQLTGVFEEPLWSWLVPGNGGNVVTDVRDLRLPVVGPGGVLATRTGTWYPLSPAADFGTTGNRVWGRDLEILAEIAVDFRRPYRFRARGGYEGGSTNSNTRWDASLRLDTVNGAVLGVDRGDRWTADARSAANDTKQYKVTAMDSGVLTGAHKILLVANTADRPAAGPSLGFRTPYLMDMTAVITAA